MMDMANETFATSKASAASSPEVRDVVGANNPSASGGVFVLVEEPAKAVASVDVELGDVVGVGVRWGQRP
jgi:hypothetical protein